MHSSIGRCSVGWLCETSLPNASHMTSWTAGVLVACDTMQAMVGDYFFDVSIGSVHIRVPMKDPNSSTHWESNREHFHARKAERERCEYEGFDHANDHCNPVEFDRSVPERPHRPQIRVVRVRVRA